MKKKKEHNPRACFACPQCGGKVWIAKAGTKKFYDAYPAGRDFILHICKGKK